MDSLAGDFCVTQLFYCFRLFQIWNFGACHIKFRC
ncbi:hypothetical protein M8C21_019796 [Ambrosia artemisiifolia]|uniref:Uncharacterized protein n=1 Tax=Ambrosia artemisiifolia TaxID=4212 RepID=A0AAD5GCE5_AMBAR|nr:hypothetical protein M8C21_019796 [Ambrosia artemisiifolia]